MPEEAVDMAELTKLHADFVEAFKSNDPKVLGALYAENAVLLPPRSNPVVGRDQIATFWQNRQRIKDLKFDPSHARFLGPDILQDVGSLDMTRRGAGGRDISVVSMKYVSIWHKVAGVWKLATSIWNGKPDAAGGRRQGAGQGGRRDGAQGGQGGRGQGGRGRGGAGQGDTGQGGFRQGGQGGRGQGGGGGLGGGQGGRGQGGRGQGGGGQGGRGQGGGGQGGGAGQGGRGQGGGGRGGRGQRANPNAPLVPQVD